MKARLILSLSPTARLTLAHASSRPAHHHNLSSPMAQDRHAPPQPTYILRGHTAQIHSVQFVRQNSRLLTGDADGFVVFWKLETKRPLAVWQAHQGAILGTGEWGRDKLITHGRDNNLRIWQLRSSDEGTLSTILPAEDSTTPRPKPWLLHTLPVNTLNFCALSMCYEPSLKATESHQDSHSELDSAETAESETETSILVATPGTDDKKINVFRFPEEQLTHVVPIVPVTDTGMVMAVKLIRPSTSSIVLVLSGYEGGLTAVHQLPIGNPSSVQPAHLVYLSRPHTQPILSLDVSPDATTYFTSSADATIAAHRIPELSAGVDRTESGATQDEACAEPSTELALGSEPVIEAGESAQDKVLPSADSSQDKRAISDTEAPSLSFTKRPVVASPSTTAAPPAGLSSLLSSAPRLKSDTPPTIVQQITIQPAHKTLNTKHAGQQSLRVRSDGRILATGGWDSRIRIYSSKTLREVAVLKWHKEGVYAVDFAQVLVPGDLSTEDQQGQQVMALTNKSLGNLQRQREQQMQLKHWIVAGAKDGKVSLWEVF